MGATLFSTPGMKGGGHAPDAVILVAVVLAILVAVALYRICRSRPEPPNSDGDDGWRKRRPEPPCGPPDRPSGGIPLDDATPARVRLRDSATLADRLPARARRPAHEPGRTPVRETAPR